MTYINHRLSDCVAQGFVGGPEWNTLVVALANGREQRNGQWLYPKHRYSAQYMHFKKAEQQEIIAAFHAARGQLHVFRFKDWNDYEAESENGDWDAVLNPSIGTTTPAQLLKQYDFGGQTTSRLIQAPVSGTVVVLRDGTPVTVTVDYTTGLVTPSVAWASGSYTWTGDHDVWVRFASDYNAFTAVNNTAATADIELVEVRR